MECLFPLDLADEEKTHGLMEHTAATYGGIDILYNNAMRCHVGTAERLPLESWNFSLEQVLTIIGWRPSTRSHTSASAAVDRSSESDRSAA